MIAMMTISRIGEACDVFVDSAPIPDARGMWCILPEMSHFRQQQRRRRRRRAGRQGKGRRHICVNYAVAAERV
jgi:hypothetical protein